jgi:hypothetical protein
MDLDSFSVQVRRCKTSHAKQDAGKTSLVNFLSFKDGG